VTAAGTGSSRGAIARSQASASSAVASASYLPSRSAQMVFISSTGSGSPSNGARVSVMPGPYPI
jgi:hypothetical protein